jgi:hypothetical protein
MEKGIEPSGCVHPEMKDFWMELSAVSIQHSAKDLFFLVFADSRQLMADLGYISGSWGYLDPTGLAGFGDTR